MATLLDILTAPVVTPDILRTRADYWTKRAERLDRRGRHEQAKRLRANCRAMRQQAREMKTRPVVSIAPAAPVVSVAPPEKPAKSPAKRPAAEPGVKRDGRWFFAQRSQAIDALRRELGRDYWQIHARPEDMCHLRLPAKYRRAVHKGTVVRWGDSHRAPAARFWPGGEIPPGCAVIPDVRTPAPESARRPNETTEEWVERLSLIRYDGAWVTPAQMIEIDAWNAYLQEQKALRAAQLAKHKKTAAKPQQKAAA